MSNRVQQFTQASREAVTDCLSAKWPLGLLPVFVEGHLYYYFFLSGICGGRGDENDSYIPNHGTPVIEMQGGIRCYSGLCRWDREYICEILKRGAERGAQFCR